MSKKEYQLVRGNKTKHPADNCQDEKNREKRRGVGRKVEKTIRKATPGGGQTLWRGTEGQGATKCGPQAGRGTLDKRFKRGVRSGMREKSEAATQGILWFDEPVGGGRGLNEANSGRLHEKSKDISQQLSKKIERTTDYRRTFEKDFKEKKRNGGTSYTGLKARNL